MLNGHSTFKFYGEKSEGNSMTQIAIYLKILGWSARHLADVLRINERGVFRWINGQNETPENVMVWLKLLAGHHTANPLPRGWGA